MGSLEGWEEECLSSSPRLKVAPLGFSDAIMGYILPSVIQPVMSPPSWYNLFVFQWHFVQLQEQYIEN